MYGGEREREGESERVRERESKEDVGAQVISTR
jgi:hypothetical protein